MSAAARLAMSMHRAEPTHLQQVAQQIASAWTTFVPARLATEAANNVVAALALDPDQPASVAAVMVIEHRIKHFGWPKLRPAAIDSMGFSAALIWSRRRYLQ